MAPKWFEPSTPHTHRSPIEKGSGEGPLLQRARRGLRDPSPWERRTINRAVHDKQQPWRWGWVESFGFGSGWGRGEKGMRGRWT